MQKRNIRLSFCYISQLVSLDEFSSLSTLQMLKFTYAILGGTTKRRTIADARILTLSHLTDI